MHMRDDRHGTTVRPRIASWSVTLSQTAGRVGPVERLIDRQQMRKVLAARVHELVYPRSPNLSVRGCFDRKRRMLNVSSPVRDP